MSSYLRQAAVAGLVSSLAVLCACNGQLTLPPAPDNSDGDFILIAEGADKPPSLFAYSEGPLRFEPPTDATYQLAPLPVSLQQLGVFEGPLAPGSRRLDVQSSWQLTGGEWAESGLTELVFEDWSYSHCLEAGLCLGSQDAEPTTLDTCVPCAADLTVPPDPPRGDCPAGWTQEQIRSLSVCNPPAPAHGYEQCPAGQRLNTERTTCIDVAPCPAGRFAAPTPGMNAIYVDSEAAGPGQGTLSDPFRQLSAVPSPAPANSEVLLSKGQHTETANLDGLTITGAGRCTALVVPSTSAAQWNDLSLRDVELTIEQSVLQLSGTSTVHNTIIVGDGSLSLQGKTLIRSSRVALGSVPGISLDTQAELRLQGVDVSAEQIVAGAGQNLVEINDCNIYAAQETGAGTYTFVLQAAELTVDNSLFVGTEPPEGKGSFSVTDSSARIRDTQFFGQKTAVLALTSSITIERAGFLYGGTAVDGRSSQVGNTDVTWRNLGNPFGKSADSSFAFFRNWQIDVSPMDLPSPGHTEFTDAWLARSELVSRFVYSSQGLADLVVNRVAIDAISTQILFGGFTSALNVRVRDFSVISDGSTMTISTGAFDADRVALIGIRQLRLEEALLANQEPVSVWKNLRVEQTPDAPKTNTLICLAKNLAIRMTNFDLRSTGGPVLGLDANEGEGFGRSQLSQGTLRLPEGELPYDVDGMCTGAPLTPQDILPKHQQVDIVFE